MLAGSQTKGKRDMRFAGSSGSTFSRRPTNPHRTNSSTIALFSDGMARKAVQVLEDRETRVLDAAPPLPVQQLQLGDAQQESRVVRFRRRTASSPSRTRAGCRQPQRLQMMFKKNLRGVGCSRGIIEPGQAKPPSCGEKPRTGPPWADLTARPSQTGNKAEGHRTPGLAFVCRACLAAWGCKSPSHPDGGEVIAKRKGVVVRRSLKEAWSKGASRWTRTGYEAYGAGRAGK